MEKARFGFSVLKIRDFFQTRSELTILDDKGFIKLFSESEEGLSQVTSLAVRTG